MPANLLRVHLHVHRAPHAGPPMTQVLAQGPTDLEAWAILLAAMIVLLIVDRAAP